MSGSLAYRPDIDGLRAVAVLCVAMFHLDLGPFTGGFVGVDVFFVISGYLITALVYGELREGRFSLAGFFVRRSLRILPALLCVLIATLLVGALLLMPADFALLGVQTAYASFGLSNFLFLEQASYFGPAAETLPLLHTWSLAVEEQYYAVGPLVLWLLMRQRPDGSLVLPALLATIAISFALSVHAVADDPEAAFYMLHSRAWELALGALLVFLPLLEGRWRVEACRAAGLALILFSALALTPDHGFPGINAVFPCIGAALVVWPADRASLTSRLLALPPLVYVGLISYSLYLWHWPVAVFARYLSYDEPMGDAGRWLLLVLSVALATCSFHAVERPFRRKRTWTKGAALRTAGLAMALVAGVGLAVRGAEGLPQRFGPSVLALASGTGDFSPLRPLCHRDTILPVAESCVLGNARVPPRAAMWADSHGVEIAAALGDVLAQSGGSLLSITYTGCPPSFVKGDRPRCPQHNRNVLAYLTGHPEIGEVLMIARYGHYDRWGREAFRKGFRQAVEALVAAGKRVTLFTPVPEPGLPVPQAAALNELFEPGAPLLLDLKKDERDSGSTRRWLQSLDRIPNVRLVELRETLCDASGCKLSWNGRSLYFDEDHLSNFGARLAVRGFRLADDPGA